MRSEQIKDRKSLKARPKYLIACATTDIVSVDMQSLASSSEEVAFWVKLMVVLI